MSSLERLARAYGIEQSYRDVWDTEHAVGEETNRALLAAMSVAAGSDAEVRESLAALDAAPALPVMVANVGDALPIDAAAGWSIVAEDGRDVSGNGAVAPDLPAGVHDLRVELAWGPVETTLILAPPRAFGLADLGVERRVWGLGAPLYGLTSARNWGLGDLADLADLAHGMAGLGADLVGINPIHALYPAIDDRISPYSPSSRRFLNVLHIAVDRVPEIDGSADAAALARVRDASLVDYPAVSALKLKALERAFATFRATPDGPRAEAFAAFRAAGGPDLERHALFEALQAHFVAEDPALGSWRAWPAACHDPNGAAVDAFSTERADDIAYFAWLQWLASEQLGAAQDAARDAGMAVGLYIDLAVGTDPGGADAWVDQRSIVGGARLGAPPDIFNPQGQDWGLAPFDPNALRAQAYAPFRRMLRQAMAPAGALRIDHALGLSRCFWTPANGAPGTYVRYPLDDLLAVIRLESHRNRCVVIGEDLGTVPKGLREALVDAGLLGSSVFYFECDKTGAFRPPEAYPAASLTTVTTHDLPTLAGFWSGRDIDWREELGLFPDPDQPARERAERADTRTAILTALVAAGLLPDGLDPTAPPADATWEIVDSVHRFIARTPSAIVLMQLEDALMAVEQANLPGTVDEHPNWRRRLEPAVEALAQDQRVQALAAALRAERPGGEGRRT